MIWDGRRALDGRVLVSYQCYAAEGSVSQSIDDL